MDDIISKSRLEDTAKHFVILDIIDEINKKLMKEVMLKPGIGYSFIQVKIDQYRDDVRKIIKEKVKKAGYRIIDSSSQYLTIQYGVSNV